MRTFDYAMTNIVLVLFTFAAFYGLWKYQYEDCITYKARNLTGDETGTVDFFTLRRGYEPGDTVRLGTHPVVIIKVMNDEEVHENK